MYTMQVLSYRWNTDLSCRYDAVGIHWPLIIYAACLICLHNNWCAHVEYDILRPLSQHQLSSAMQGKEGEGEGCFDSFIINV